MCLHMCMYLGYLNDDDMTIMRHASLKTQYKGRRAT